MSTTESAAIQDKLEEVTTCCICEETYRDPKILPCVHTFCLTCLQRSGTQSNKKPGDPMPCPLCRQEFTVPEEGFAAVKKNFFMERLVEIVATRQGASSVCDKHEHENLCLYCSDCNEVLCLVCLRESHQNHRLSDLSSAAIIFRSQLQSDAGTAKRCISNALKKKERLAQKKIAILEKIEGLEIEVCQVRSDLKALIDQHAESILQNLGLLKKKGIKDIEMEEKELEKHLASLENFEKCCSQLTSNDRHDSLICKLARELKGEIVELELLNKSTIERQWCSFEINFTKTVPAPLEAFRKKDSGNLIGKVEAKVDYSMNPELVATIETNNAAETKAKIDYSMNPELVATIEANNTAETKGDGISGMTVSNNKVFIAYNQNPVVSIYDSNTLKYVSSWTVEHFVSYVDLRNCASEDGTVYIVNWDYYGISKEILRIDQNLVLSKWSTKNDWAHLSVSDASTIVATCCKTSALREYSLDGTLLHEIKLCRSIVHPYHAIKLDNGHFAVSHGGYEDDINRVCIVNHVGGIMKSFGDLKGSSIRQLNVPTCLAVDEHGNILVLDTNNGRVLLLSPALEFKRELLTKANGLQRPVAMHLDEKTSRLYIADNKWENFQWRNGKLFVFNIK